METLLWAMGIAVAVLGLVGEAAWRSLREEAKDMPPWPDEPHFEPWDGTL